MQRVLVRIFKAHKKGAASQGGDFSKLEEDNLQEEDIAQVHKLTGSRKDLELLLILHRLACMNLNFRGVEY